MLAAADGPPAPAPALPQCPTCGLTPTEPHPRRAGVDRCANCKTHAPAEDAAVPPELTAEEARAEVDRLAGELYRAQDGVEYVAEMCAIRERQQRASQPGGGEVFTGEVLLWLEGPKCSRVQAACSGTDGFCPAHGFHRHAPAPDGLRDLYAAALEAADYRPDMRRGDLAGAVLAVRDEELQRLAARIVTLEHVAVGNKRHVQMLIPELERAETTLASVRAECDRIEAAVRANPQDPDFDGAYLAAIGHIRTALTPEDPS